MKTVRKILVANTARELQLLVDTHVAKSWLEMSPRIVSRMGVSGLATHRQVIERHVLDATPAAFLSEYTSSSSSLEPRPLGP